MNNLPVKIDLSFYEGDSWTQKFRFLNDGTPVNLTGAAVASTARAAGALYYDLLVDTSGASNGEVVISPPVIDMKPGLYNYDVEVNQAGDVQTWVNGQMLISQAVTVP